MGRPRIDMTGQRFTRWLVLGFSHKIGFQLLWLCRCDCGTERAVYSAELKNGGSKSCGCLAREQSSQRNSTHGHSNRSSTYVSWQSMIARCERPNFARYERYGGRGIKVCKKWRNSFAAFLADMGPRPAGTSIDRKNTDGNYHKRNCRWSTPKQQANNRSKR